MPPPPTDATGGRGGRGGGEMESRGGRGGAFSSGGKGGGTMGTGGTERAGKDFFIKPAPGLRIATLCCVLIEIPESTLPGVHGVTNPGDDVISVGVVPTLSMCKLENG